MCIEKADGAYMYDKDGNKYIDFLQAGGPTILGSNYKPVQDAVIDLIKNCGPTTGLLHEAELMIAKEIHKHMPNVEMFRMLGSGTEACMASLRIARIATGKKRVIKIGGAYHGWSDQLVYGLKIPGSRYLLESHGIPKGAYRLTDEVRPNDLNMLEAMLKRNKLKGGTAAVLIEPVGPESGTRPVAREYNKGVRALCDKYGALMIFDEVVTGFRVALSGAQGFFDVVPDLTIFGKIVAGGYPAAGGVGGKKEYAQLMAAGLATGKHRAYVGGTLAANPLSSLAGYTAIKEIERTNACEVAGRMGDRLCDGLKELVDRYGLPFVAYNQGSIVHLECTGAMSFDFSSMSFIKSAMGLLKNKDMMYVRKDSMEKMGAAYMANGIITLAGSRLYTSLADTPEIIDEALNRFENVFKHVKKTDKGLVK
ncbi:MAG: aminotransferase class III-fold pyridoxal phosphate-dependent enzyme [Lachnospiraceae bacterium]|nr:aminotransferase class III-fold pyridoxal phosphate-dependent enzyme [Lachnospiraceae bacterium]